MIKEIFYSLFAGIITFISPCILPLLPAYIFYITGLKASEKHDDKIRFFIKILFFIIGFTIIFVFFGILTSLLTLEVVHIKKIITIILGTIVIIFGLHFIGIINIFFLNYEARFNFSKIHSTNLGALLIGMAFASGWTPCIGPILATILALVANEGKLFKGTFLLLIYSLGLGIPFLLSGLFFNQLKPALNFLKKHSNKTKIISGVFLIIIGILILSDSLTNIIIYLNKLGYFLEENLFLSNIIMSIMLMLAGFLFLIFMLIKKKINYFYIIASTFFFMLGILNYLKILSLIKLFINYLLYQGI